jgi:hypothetical protein
MSYKELKEDKESEEPKNTNGVAYADIMGTILVTAMMCATVLITTSMWIQERQSELVYLRGSSP